MHIPTLETARLRLRAHRLDDFSDCLALWTDPLVTRYIGGVPLSPEEVWTRILRYAGHWALLGYGYWVAEEKDTKTFAGELGFADYKRDLNPPLQDIPEAGWVFASAMYGKGYATEALQAIHSWGKVHFKCSQTACIIHPENAPSLRVAEKIGYKESVRTLYKGKPTILFFRNN